MSLQVFHNGKQIGASGINVRADHVDGASGTFSLDPSVTIASGDTVLVMYDGKSLASGVITGTTLTSGRPTGVSFSTRYNFSPRISPNDQSVIDNFLIDSFARGFAKSD